MYVIIVAAGSGQRFASDTPKQFLEIAGKLAVQHSIDAFDTIEDRLDNIKKQLRQGKIETIKVYREQPDTFAVVKPTDLINDFLSDIETLLK